MSLKVCFSIFAAVLLGILPATPQARAENAPQTPDTSLPESAVGDDWDALQARLAATPEEWSVLYPQLKLISTLRNELQATADTTAARRGLFGGAFEGPMGGTSLDAPMMPKGSGRGTPQEHPFDPKTAPGAPTAGVGLLRGLVGRVLIDMIVPEQRHPMQTALTELQTLLDSFGTTDAQIREKLAAVRALRHKVLRDLAAARNELVPYLTVRQTAILVSLGYLD